MKAHWPSGPASLSSLSHCPQYQERPIVLFLQYGLSLAYHVEVNAKTTTSAEQLLTHLLNEWGKKRLSQGLCFAFCISTAWETPPSSLLLLPFTMALLVFAFSPHPHIFSVNTIQGNKALSKRVGDLVSRYRAEGISLFLRAPQLCTKSFSIPELASFFLTQSKMQAKIFISFRGPLLGLSLRGLGPAWRPGLFTPLWLP